MVAPTFSETELRLVTQQLPTAPRLLVELSQIIRQPRVDAAEITAVLRQDPALVARLIRMANSPAYRRSEPAVSIEEALAAVGFSEVHRLIGVVAATQLASHDLTTYGIDGTRLQANSLFVAVLMEELAEISGEEPRSCYTVGLLRSIGKMAFERLADGDTAVQPFAATGVTDLEMWEQSNWGTTSCEVAAHILLTWRLPQEIVLSIRHHYHPALRHNPIVHLLSLAAGAAEQRGLGLAGEEYFWKPSPENLAKAGIDAQTFDAVTHHAQRTYERLHAAAQ